MNKKLENTLSNSKLIMIFGILAAVLYLAADLPYFFMREYMAYRFDFMVQLVLAVSIIALLMAYKKGATNLQKALISGMLFCSFIETYSISIEYADMAAVGFTYAYGLVLFFIFAVCEGAILISHLVLQTEHSGNFNAIKVILVAVIVGIIANLVDVIVELKSGIGIGSLYLLNNIGEDFFLLMVLCIETKIQLYNRTRSEAIASGEWTAETKAKAKEIFKF